MVPGFRSLFSPRRSRIGISVRLCPSRKVFAGFNRVRSFEDNFPLFIIHLELDGLPVRGPSISLLKANQDLLLSVFKGSVVSSVINVSELEGGSPKEG